MITVRVDLAAVKKLKERVVTQANRKYRTHVYAMFEDALKVSAQFSGDYVSNWRIQVGSATDPGYQMWPGKVGEQLGGGYSEYREQAHQAGDLQAVAYAREYAARLPFTYKDKVYFVNPTPLVFAERTVTSEIDGGVNELRPENIIGAGVLLKSYLKSKYGTR